MLRSLYTGISGLRSMQTLMDVTGNNIANVNTAGYKSTNTVFEDTLSQTLRTASGSVGANGGTNPAQVGLGVRVSSITTNFTQGATQNTGRNTDMLINGDGFFVVQDQGVNEYTRNGSFSLDKNGQLVTANGAKVMGWPADVSGNISTAAAVSPLTIPAGKLSNPKATATVNLTGYLNNAADGDIVDTTDPAYAAGVDEALAKGSEFSVTYPIYDNQGKSNNVSLTFTPQKQPVASAGTTVTQWVVKGAYGSQNFDGVLKLDSTATPPRKWTDGGAAASATHAVTTGVGTDGSFSVTGLKGSDGAAFNVKFDVSAVTSSAQSGETSTARIDSQDGHAAASLSSWTLGQDGTITGVFSDSSTQSLGKVAMASFNNPAGLSKNGGSTYSATVNSGTANIGSAGDNGRGSITSGALEMSNVDLAQEFTNLIISQRGFQANSKVITTSDDLLQTLVNLK